MKLMDKHTHPWKMADGAHNLFRNLWLSENGEVVVGSFVKVYVRVYMPGASGRRELR